MRRSRCLSILAVAPVAAALIASQTAIASAATSAPAGTASAGTASAGTASAGTVPAAFTPLTTTQAARLSRNATTPVIVILRSQLAQAAAGTAAARTRADAVRTNQRPLLSELAEVHATHVQQYQLVNSLSATVSAGEEARLKTDPQIAEVIPDQTITLQAPPSGPSGTSARPRTAPARTTSLKANVVPGACPKNQTQLAPEGLSLTSTASSNAKAATARALGFTGSGVTVGFIADGIDTQNVNFLRSNGKSVFTGYRDFSGNGAGAPTSGDEAFLDANTIAGQGLHTYNLNGLAAQSYPNACDVKIEGVAPGASLVGLDAISESPQDQLEVTTSNLIEAINYAVETDHVNVLNESFGVNQLPDLAADATREFDDAAVKAGVVVAVASGDSGSANTIASPASDPDVISAGASTQFQLYAQGNVGAARYFAPKGWLSDNISSLSSAGTDNAGATVDLVAPGDLSVDSCDAIGSLFSGCENFSGAASDIGLAGGTSEAAPFAAGAAALVIQAYRKTHGGGTPSPALVKQILTSTATDLGTPTDEQGAGLLNSYKAVEAAESYGNGTRTGQTLLASASQLNAAAAPGTPESWQLSVTNTGAQAQTVRMSGRAIGPDQQVQAGRVTLNDKTSDQFTDNTGEANNYQVFHFTVPANRQRLDASIAWPGNQNLFSPVSLTLVDPAGRLAANSDPQGFGNFGTVDVRYPAAGTWTGVIYSPTNAGNGGFAGKVAWRVATEQFAAFGGVWPSSLTIAPGASGTFTFAMTTPSSPGDSAGSIVLNAGAGGTTSIPVTLRSQIPVTTSRAGTFSGVLTGGNGRPGAEAQENSYEFTVPAGVQSISAGLALANDPSDAVGAFLVSPDGDTLGYGENSLTNPSSGSPESPGTSLAAYTLHPAAGTWTLELEFAQPVAGNEVSDAFTGSVAFNATKAVVT
ncbi:MAG: hypothetical protein ACRDN0_06415, partial [Trebonia sp.]